MIKKQTTIEELRNKKTIFYDKLNSGELTIGQATKEMRKIVGLTQLEYAKLLNIYPRNLLEIEKDRGNPTLETLNKIAKPFGLTIGFIHKN